MAGKDYGPKGCCGGTALIMALLGWATVAEIAIKAQLVLGWLA